jgi:hypothetical protein
VTPPLLAVTSDIADLEFMGYSLDFHHPLLSADRRLNDLILLVFILLVLSLVKVSKVFDVIIVILLVSQICDVTTALHILSHIISFIVKSS